MSCLRPVDKDKVCSGAMLQMNICYEYCVTVTIMTLCGARNIVECNIIFARQIVPKVGELEFNH